MQNNVIMSRSNEKIKQLIKLINDKKTRNEQNAIVLEGVRLCKGALEFGVNFRELYVSEEFAATEIKFMADIMSAETNITYVSAELFERISSKVQSQGVIAVCHKPEVAQFNYTVQEGIYLALENIQDPGNLGTIIRTACALGCSGIIYSANCCEIYNTKVVRSAMASLFKIPLYYQEDFEHFIDNCNKNGFDTYATIPNSENLLKKDFTFSQKSIIILGNEANGLTESTISKSSKTISIQMQNNSESLNVAGTAAIFLWEALQ